MVVVVELAVVVVELAVVAVAVAVAVAVTVMVMVMVAVAVMVMVAVAVAVAVAAAAAVAVVAAARLCGFWAAEWGASSAGLERAPEVPARHRPVRSPCLRPRAELGWLGCVGPVEREGEPPAHAVVA